MAKKINIPTWCAGCGAFIVKASLEKAISNLKISKKKIVACFDIGCSGNMINLMDISTVATLHGRSIPFACGVKSGNPSLKVIAQAGDGGLLNEGLNHFVHAIQRNAPITLIVSNNQVFGLTAGQQSSATPKGVRARATSSENPNLPLSVVDLAATAGAKFIARVPETEMKMMIEIFEKALQYDGLAIIEIIQPCKIWAKKFPQRNFKKVSPVKNRTDLIGKEDNIGLLYKER